MNEWLAWYWLFAGLIIGVMAGFIALAIVLNVCEKWIEGKKK